MFCIIFSLSVTSSSFPVCLYSVASVEMWSLLCYSQQNPKEVRIFTVRWRSKSERDEAKSLRRWGVTIKKQKFLADVMHCESVCKKDWVKIVCIFLLSRPWAWEGITSTVDKNEERRWARALWQLFACPSLLVLSHRVPRGLLVIADHWRISTDHQGSAFYVQVGLFHVEKGIVIVLIDFTRSLLFCFCLFNFH